VFGERTSLNRRTNLRVRRPTKRCLMTEIYNLVLISTLLVWVTTATTVRAANPSVPVPARAARRGTHKLQRNLHRASGSISNSWSPGSIVDQSRVYFSQSGSSRRLSSSCFMPVYPAALKSRSFATRDVVVRLSAGNGVCVRSIPLSVCHAHPAHNMNCIVWDFRKKPAGSSRSAESVILGRGTWRTGCGLRRIPVAQNADHEG
jgi:hypothetical protein